MLSFRDLVAGEVLEDAHEAGMVPALAAERGGGVEQFLRRRGVRQGQVERARALTAPGSDPSGAVRCGSPDRRCA